MLRRRDGNHWRTVLSDPPMMRAPGPLTVGPVSSRKESVRFSLWGIGAGEARKVFRVDGASRASPRVRRAEGEMEDREEK